MTRITAVTLSRTACFGTCPIYDVTLRARGFSSWHGEMFTDRIGDYRGEVEGGDFERLAAFIERCGFFNWDASYSAPIQITDQPSYVLTVRRGGDTKSVSQYATDEPPDFWAIAAIVDAVANDVSWIPLARRQLHREAC
jgi:hypothetical protein